MTTEESFEQLKKLYETAYGIDYNWKNSLILKNEEINKCLEKLKSFGIGTTYNLNIPENIIGQILNSGI